MNLDRYAQDCSELHAAGVGRVWLCRLLRPTLGKKFFMLFAILAATGVANWLVVDNPQCHHLKASLSPCSAAREYSSRPSSATVPVP